MFITDSGETTRTEEGQDEILGWTQSGFMLATAPTATEISCVVYAFLLMCSQNSRNKDFSALNESTHWTDRAGSLL